MKRTQMIRTLLVAACGLLAWCGAAQAQRVYWDTPNDPLGVGQRASLDLVFADTQPIGRIVPPPVDGLSFGPPSQASDVSIVNGRRSASVTLSYPTRPDRKGSFTIPSFEVETPDGRQTVPALTVDVTSAMVPDSRSSATAEDVDQVVDVRLTPSNMTPYVGEIIDLDVTVGLHAGHNGQVVGTPAGDTDGVLAEPWSDGEPVTSARGSAVRFHSRAVATAAGRLQVAPVQQEVQIESNRARRDPFDGFGDALDAMRKFGGADLLDSFFARAQASDVTVKSNAVQLDVQPLPQPAPPGFSGAVGQFELESSLAPSELKTGEPITWTLRLKGTGNWPGDVELPARAVPAEFRALTPKQHKEFADGARFTGSVSEDLVLVPNKAGDYRLDPVRFVYFDPHKGQYQTIEARTPPLLVSGAPVAEPPQHVPAPLAAAAPASPTTAAAVAPAAAPAPVLPRDPRHGTALGFAPISASQLRLAIAVPFALALFYWVALALRRARLSDPRRPQREALARLAAAVGRVLSADGAEERIAALLAWQRTAATALSIRAAAPTAGALPAQPWAEVWAASERAIYGREHRLPAGWCEHALALCAQTRRPRFSLLGAIRVRDLVPRAAAAALLLGLAITPAYAADPLDAYAHGDFAGARQALLGRVQATPADWIARYDLGLAEAQVGNSARALGETVAAFVHAPADADVRWNVNAFAADVPDFDHGARALTARPLIAGAVSPAAWQVALVAAALLACGGLALVLRRRYAGAPGVPWRAWMLVAVSAALGASALVSLRTYGMLADARAAMVAEQAILRSVPTDAEPAQQQRSLPAGALVVVEQEFLGWQKVGLSSGETGWLRKGDLVPLYAAPSV